jgi:glycosyltransferase involved in cell wall biosynthesis
MRPAVTFALFAYNQEKYVRAAIEGAFAQDFEPLEIILSDDCSSDRTFAIMQEMAAAYTGPHRVTARQERPNAGPVQHLINVARVATGELMVVGAGDDISYPDRVSALHSAWKETGAAGLSSWHDEIDEAGNILAKDVSFPPSPITAMLFRHSEVARRDGGFVASVPGFCAAYPREFWAEMPDPPSRQYVEDGLATILLNLEGKQIVRVPQTLIAYRLLDHSLSNRKGGLNREAIENREAKIDFLASNQVQMMRFLFALVERRNIPVDLATRRQLERHFNHGSVIAGYWKQGKIGRLARLARARMASDIAFLLPRLFGRRIFSTFRLLVERRRGALVPKTGRQ